MSDREKYLHDPWYRLDNAGKIFSAVLTKRITTLFRLQATLTKPVHVGKLRGALHETMARFPYFAVQLRPGVFWHYLDINRGDPPLVADACYPCLDYAYKGRGNFPFRLRAYHRRIALEFAHAVTDGTGALEFMRSLVAVYLKHEGVPLPAESDLMLPGEPPDPEEFEDGFRRYWNPGIPSPRQEERAYHVPYRLDPPGVYRVSTGLVPVAQVLEAARERDVSLGELLTAVLLDAFQQTLLRMPARERKRRARPIRVDVPVNLRRHFPTRTMRNFFLPVFPGIDPRLGEYSFDDILAKVHHYMQSEVDTKYLSQQMARNVRTEVNPLIRVVPVWLKDLVLTVVYDVMSQNRTTSGLSNLGQVRMPAPLDRHVERFEFIPAPPTRRRIGCGVISYGETLYVTFGRITRECWVERYFFRRLLELGIPVRVQGNGAQGPS